jgi:hypothetical protein
MQGQMNFMLANARISIKRLLCHSLVRPVRYATLLKGISKTFNCAKIILMSYPVTSSGKDSFTPVGKDIIISLPLALYLATLALIKFLSILKWLAREMRQAFQSLEYLPFTALADLNGRNIVQTSSLIQVLWMTTFKYCGVGNMKTNLQNAE